MTCSAVSTTPLRRTLLTLAVAAAAAAALVISASALELPKDVYFNMKGEWNVEVASPCMPSFLDGAVLVANGSSRVFLSDGTEFALTAAVIDGEASHLRLDGLQPFLTTAGGVSKDDFHSYAVCRTQTNYMPTDKRPLVGSRMQVTQISEMTGAVSAAAPDVSDVCSPTASGVILRTISMPTKTGAAGGKDAMPVDAVQYLEIVIDTRALPNTCIGSKDGDAAEKKKTRKRRGGVRNTVGTSEASSEDAEIDVANGFAVLRFSRRNTSDLSLFERYYTSLMFIGIFILYRIVYAYFSYQSSK